MVWCSSPNKQPYVTTGSFLSQWEVLCTASTQLMNETSVGWPFEMKSDRNLEALKSSPVVFAFETIYVTSF